MIPLSAAVASAASAALPVAALPSRPSDVVSPRAANLAKSSLTALDKPTVIVSPFAVVSISLVVPFTFNV